MKFNTPVIIKALVCLEFNFLLLFVTDWHCNFPGTSFAPGSALTARLYGFTLWGNFILRRMARIKDESTVRHAIARHLFIYGVIVFIAGIIILHSGNVNRADWGRAAVFIFFTSGIGYFLLPPKTPIYTQSVSFWLGQHLQILVSQITNGIVYRLSVGYWHK